MRVVGAGMPEFQAVTQSSDKPTPTPQAAPPSLQSAVLQPALAALRDMPDIDEAKIEALRAALARGDVPFDASRLAGLIERYHGGHK